LIVYSYTSLCQHLQLDVLVNLYLFN